jgi:hypothetical protein
VTFVFRKQLDEVSAQRTVDFYNALSEKDARRFAALEAKKLERGGVR